MSNISANIEKLCRAKHDKSACVVDYEILQDMFQFMNSLRIGSERCLS